MELLGEDFLAWVVLALGAAMVAGNALALSRPRPRPESDEGELERAPVVRSVVMIAVGLLAAIWAIASLTGA